VKSLADAGLQFLKGGHTAQRKAKPSHIMMAIT
jgi:hypothetical protein